MMADLVRPGLGFSAAAALPQQLEDRLQGPAAAHGSRMQMTTSWGLTRTAPAATSAQHPIIRSDVLGVPLPRPRPAGHGRRAPGRPRPGGQPRIARITCG